MFEYFGGWMNIKQKRGGTVIISQKRIMTMIQHEMLPQFSQEE